MSSATPWVATTAGSASRRVRWSRTGPRPRGARDPTVPSGHWTRTSAPSRPAEPDVDPAELAAGVPATDRRLPTDGRVAHLDLEPGADRVPVRAGLGQAEGQPMPGRRRRSPGPVDAGVPPEPDRRVEEGLDEVGQAVEVEVGEGGAPAALVVEDAGGLGHLGVRAVGLAEEEVRRVAARVVGLLVDVALRDEEVDQPVVVDVLELRVPGGRRQRVATGRRPGRGHAELERQVPVGRLRWSAGESLEDVRTLARQVRRRGSRRRRRHSCRCPCPGSGPASSHPRPCTAGVPRPARSARAAPARRSGRCSSGGRC